MSIKLVAIEMAIRLLIQYNEVNSVVIREFNGFVGQKEWKQ